MPNEVEVKFVFASESYSYSLVTNNGADRIAASNKMLPATDSFDVEFILSSSIVD